MKDVSMCISLQNKQAHGIGWSFTLAFKIPLDRNL